MKIWERNGKCKQQKCENDPAKASARQSKEMCEIQEGLRRHVTQIYIYMTCFATTYQSYHLSIQLIPFKGVRTPSR